MSGEAGPRCAQPATHEPSQQAVSAASGGYQGHGRVFVCGDIHGCLEQLETQLRLVGFDKARDRLFALGDLVDRGPESAAVVMLLDEPWFDSIKGNHEVIMEAANAGEDPELHICNGGGWFALLPQEERDGLVARVAGLPIAMTVTTPSGRKIGLVHADLPGADWDEFMAQLDRQDVRDYALWARERVRNAARGGLVPIRGVDHVYFGHTPVREPLHAANMSWIDTGCFATGRITLVELL